MRAYDDAQGVTAEFNRNVLNVLNREVGGDFDVDAFEHVALWNAEQEWIEMRLRAKRAMRVTLAELGLTVEFREGEELRTEVSAKFREEGVQQELADGGLRAAPLVDRFGGQVRRLAGPSGVAQATTRR